MIYNNIQRKRTDIAAIIVSILLVLTLCFSFKGAANAVNIVKGDTSNNVVAVQSKLKQWGYYAGIVDGVFGSKTRSAVVYFQRVNGLTADGIVGASTEAAMGLNLGTSYATVGAGKIAKGNTAANIKAVQTVLKRWGYYTGYVDGIWGSRTTAAVVAFQRKNGLFADGIVGARTEAAMGLNLTSSVKAQTSASGDLYLLAKCIYAESRGEPYTGQVAVGAVILNRVKSSKFPNSISGVIYQPGAFTAVADGQMSLSPNQTAINAAGDAMNGWDPTNGCLYYYNPATATSSWIWSLQVTIKIGKHNFAKA